MYTILEYICRKHILERFHIYAKSQMISLLNMKKHLVILIYNLTN